MLDKDQILLERAYLTLSKAIAPKRSLEAPGLNPNEELDNEREEIVSSGPVTEPAPGVDMEMVGDHESIDDMGSEESDTTGVPVDLTSEVDHESHDNSEEHEEDEMSIDNLNSIRESIVKVASFCASGGHLVTWQQQKLAIAMDNLAGVARSLR